MKIMRKSSVLGTGQEKNGLLQKDNNQHLFSVLL